MRHGASLRRFYGAAWSVVWPRGPILDWRTLMVDLRHVVRSGTATERYFGCNPSAGERRKWPRRRGNTRRDVRSRPLGTTHCVLRCTDCQKRRVPPIVAGGVQSWCAGAGGRWGGSGTVARGSFETRSTRADDAMDSGRTITRINGDRNSMPIATVTNFWVQTPCHRSSVLHANTSFFDAVGAVCGKHFP